jgi:hypothetical protein
MMNVAGLGNAGSTWPAQLTSISGILHFWHSSFLALLAFFIPDIRGIR